MPCEKGKTGVAEQYVDFTVVRDEVIRMRVVPAIWLSIHQMGVGAGICRRSLLASP